MEDQDKKMMSMIVIIHTMMTVNIIMTTGIMVSRIFINFMLMMFNNLDHCEVQNPCLDDHDRLDMFFACPSSIFSNLSINIISQN